MNSDMHSSTVFVLIVCTQEQSGKGVGSGKRCQQCATRQRWWHGDVECEMKDHGLVSYRVTDMRDFLHLLFAGNRAKKNVLLLLLLTMLLLLLLLILLLVQARRDDDHASDEN